MYNYYIPSSKYITQANTPLRLQNGPLITIPNLINETLQPHHIEKMQALRGNEHLQAAGLQSQLTHMPGRVKAGLK